MSFWEESSDLIKSKLVRKVEAASADETKRATIPGAVAAELPPQFGPVRKDRSRLLESSARSQAKKKVGRAALDKTNEGWGFPSVKSAETAEKKAKAKLKGDKEYDRLKKLTGIRPIRVGNKVTAGEAKPTRVIGGVSSGGDPTDDGSQSFVGALGESIMGVIKRPYKLGRKVGKKLGEAVESQRPEGQRKKRLVKERDQRVARDYASREYSYGQPKKDFGKVTPRTKALYAQWKTLPRGKRNTLLRTLKQRPGERPGGVWTPATKELLNKFDNSGFIELLRSKGKVRRRKNQEWSDYEKSKKRSKR